MRNVNGQKTGGPYCCLNFLFQKSIGQGGRGRRGAVWTGNAGGEGKGVRGKGRLRKDSVWEVGLGNGRKRKGQAKEWWNSYLPPGMGAVQKCPETLHVTDM